MAIVQEKRDMMNANIRKIVTAQYVFQVFTLFFGYFLVVFALKMMDSGTEKEENIPGIDLKEFR